MKIVHQIILLFVIYQYSLYPISFIPFVQFNIEIFTNQIIVNSYNKSKLYNKNIPHIKARIKDVFEIYSFISTYLRKLILKYFIT